MCTLEKRGGLFVLTLTGDDEHRLTPSFVDSIRSSLSQAKSQATRGSVLITVAQGRFFSNGFDLPPRSSAATLSEVQEYLSHRVQAFKSLVADLISLPMPTVAAVTGHASAAGFLLAISHDYVLMRRDRGVLYMSELDLGVPLPDYFTAVIKTKIGTAGARRDVVLRAAKLRAEEAVNRGIVDSAHDSAESTVEAAMRLGEQLAGRKWDGRVYAELRKSLCTELCGTLGLTDQTAVSRL